MMKKARKRGTTEVHCFELDLVNEAPKTPRNGSQPSIHFWGILDVIEALEYRALDERYADISPTIGSLSTNFRLIRFRYGTELVLHGVPRIRFD